MGLFSWIPGIGGALDDILDNATGARANDLQSQALDNDRLKTQAYLEQSGRYRQLYEKLYGAVQAREKAGDFDPDKYEAEFQRDFEANNRNALPNLATAQAVAGYRPGDSEAVRRDNLLKRGLAESYRKGRFNARRQALSDLQSAYSGAIPELIGQTGGAAAMGYGNMAEADQRAANFARGNTLDVGSLYQLYMQTQRRRGDRNGPVDPYLRYDTEQYA